MSNERPSAVVVVASLLILGAFCGWFGHRWLSGDEASPAPRGGGAGGPNPDEPPARDVRDHPDIFLFTIDTLRADHLTIYGYDKQTAPFLAQVSRRAHAFGNVVASSSWTVPSLATLHTGLLPIQHGLSRNPSLGSTSSEVEIRALSPEAHTLAERLGEAGYETYAIVANTHLPEGAGFEQGFDHYKCLGFTRAPRVELSVEHFAGELQRRRKPVFVWVHYFDPHDPYRKFHPFVYTFVDDFDDYQRRRKADTSLSAVDRKPLANLMMSDLEQRSDLVPGGEGLPILEALYDSEIRLVDDQIQLLYGDFAIEDDDVVVITADHGEEFRDHGRLGHRNNLYEETLRVPLLISWPAVWPEPRRTSARISLADVMPTLAEIGGVPLEDGEVPAQSLVPLLEGDELEQRYPVTAELVRDDGGHLQAIYDDSMKLIVHVNDPGAPELYDLSRDPGETTNLAASQPGYVRDLTAALNDHLQGAPPLPPSEVSTELPPALIEQLRAMGYIR